MSTVAHLPGSAELLTHPSQAGGRGNSTSREDFLHWLVPTVDKQAFLAAVFNRTEVIEIAPGPPPVTITRVVPLQDPLDPELYALDFDWVPFTCDMTSAQPVPWNPAIHPWPWNIIKFRIKFGFLPYSFTDRPYVSVRRSGRSGAITLPNVAYTFLGNGERIAQDVGIPCFGEDLVVTWHEVTDLAAALGTIEPLAGLVNSAGVTVSGRTYPAGVLHFPEFDAEESVSFGGVRKASISFPVRWRPRPTWLQAMRRDGTLDTLVPAPLPTGDLNPLFG